MFWGGEYKDDREIEAINFLKSLADEEPCDVDNCLIDLKPEDLIEKKPVKKPEVSKR